MLKAALIAAVLLAASPSGAKLYWCFGDSITFGEGGKNTDAYLGSLDAFLEAAEGPTDLVNLGKGGENTNDGLARLQALLASASPKPDVVLLMEGTNDVLQWIMNPGFLDPSQTRANLTDMVQEVKAAGPTAVLATVAPRFKDGFDSDNSLTIQLNDIVKQVAALESVPLAPVYDNLFPRRSKYTYLDSLHPSALGHTLVAEAFGAAITGKPVSGIDLAPPLPVLIDPAPSSSLNPVNLQVRIHVVEDEHPFDAATAQLTIDGVVVTPQFATGSTAGEVDFTYVFPEDLKLGQKVSVAFHVADANAPPNALDLSYSFSASPGNGTGGDIDHSGRVDGLDLGLLALAFGSAKGDERYEFEADIDGSGFIDGLDLSFLAAKFGGPP